MINVLQFGKCFGRTTIGLIICSLMTCLSVVELSASVATELQTATQSKNVSITGVIADANGKPLTGVVVVAKGTNIGATTNVAGRYQISVPKNSVLTFSMLGYTSVDITVIGDKTVYNVTLKDSAVTIDDVVVIGYGEMTKKDLTGTVSTISKDELVKSPVMSLDQALQGRMAGVQITSYDGQPGVDNDIVIRGANSLTQDNAPLYVIDGFPMESFSLSTIDANDVKSISVLKDASATAIYGSRGANGVIVIETKGGDIGKAKVTYSGQVGFQQTTKTMDLMNAYDYVDYQLELSGASAVNRFLTNEGMTHDDYRNVKAIDWQDQLFRNALMTKHNISISGGNKETKYSISGSYADQDGVINNSGYKRYQGKISLIQQLRKNVSLRINANYSEDEKSGQAASADLGSTTGYSTYLMYRTWAFIPLILKNYDSEGDEDEDTDEGGYSAMFDGAVMNPIISNANERVSKKVRTLTANAQLDWKILPELKFSVQGGINRKNIVDENFYNSLTYKGRLMSNNSDGVNADYKSAFTNDWVNENTLTYTKTFNRKHKLDVLGGFTLQANQNNTYGFRTILIPNDNLGMSVMDDGTLQGSTAGINEYTLMSFLGRVNYGYKSKYLFTLTYRADGSSKFSKGNKWGYFPSGAFAWRMGEEKFMRGLKFINDAKLRASWGITGNNRVGVNSRYAYLSLGDWYSFNNGTPQPAYGIYGLGNNDLRWEATEQIDLGYDLSMFDSRVNFTVDLYRKTTRDLLLNANVSSTLGVSKVYKNVGKVRNDGLELSLNTVNVNTRNFRWTSDINISFNRSKVLELADGEQYLTSMVAWTGNFNSTPLYITQVGGPLTAFYGYIYDGLYQISDFDISTSGTYSLKKGVPANGSESSTIMPGHIKFKDIDDDGDITSADRVVMGRAEPLHTGGFNNVFNYKSFELSIFLRWNYGNKVMNANRMMFEGNQSGRAVNQFASYADRYKLSDATTHGSDNYSVGGCGPLGFYSTKTLEDGSYLRLQTVQLAYNFKQKALAKIGINALQIFVSGQNLWTLSGYSGLDPEVSTRHTALTPGFDYSSYARNRVFMGGVKITF